MIIFDNHGVVSSKQYVERVVELGGREEHTTNNRMELRAAIESLNFLTTYYILPTTITINTDSEYVMKGMTEWIEGWQKKGWRTAAKKPVLNQDLWQELLRASEGKNVVWKYVAGHSGHDLNERCDEIATSFADNAPSELYEGPKSGYKVIL